MENDVRFTATGAVLEDDVQRETQVVFAQEHLVDASLLKQVIVCFYPLVEQKMWEDRGMLVHASR